ncbi:MULTISPECIES: helix-turn-helix domain-containing protein [unclassified Chelatococcus]|uniref:MerR family transcriptional regulator n=2 Tax=unclassified Chelatococcus TaxID=2638111 RepID=UPI0003806E92|nr:MerR family transcriptional regulator [Chelatococcus sp. CO-6]
MEMSMRPNLPEDLSIGALSEATGVNIETIRYYEKIGLLPPPPRTEGRQRRYDGMAVRRLRFIRHARDLGFSVDAIRDLIAMAADPAASCSGADAIARAHLKDVERRIAQLAALRDEIARMLDHCGDGTIADCRVIEVLADHGQCLHEDHRTPA